MGPKITVTVMTLLFVIAVHVCIIAYQLEVLEVDVGCHNKQAGPESSHRSTQQHP